MWLGDPSCHLCVFVRTAKHSKLFALIFTSIPLCRDMGWCQWSDQKAWGRRYLNTFHRDFDKFLTFTSWCVFILKLVSFRKVRWDLVQQRPFGKVCQRVWESIWYRVMHLNQWFPKLSSPASSPSIWGLVRNSDAQSHSPHTCWIKISGNLCFLELALLWELAPPYEID